jgi:hypothetical protein
MASKSDTRYRLRGVKYLRLARGLPQHKTSGPWVQHELFDIIQMLAQDLFNDLGRAVSSANP